MRTHPGTSLCFVASPGCPLGHVPRELRTSLSKLCWPVRAVSPAAVELGRLVLEPTVLFQN